MRYLRNRKKSKIRIANFRLNLNMFEFRNSRAAQKRIKSVFRHRTKNSQFQLLARANLNKLNIVLMCLNLAPGPKWAKPLAGMGLVRVNGKIVRNFAQRLEPGDTIQLQPKKIKKS